MIRIVTPLSRPENLRRMYASLRHHLNCDDATWHIIIDASVEHAAKIVAHGINYIRSPHWRARAGHAHRNFALDHLGFDRSDMIYFLDDDTIIHQDLITELRRAHGNVVMFDQYVRRKYLPFLIRVRKVDPENVRVNMIDTGMFAFRLEAADGLKWDENLYEADGVFAQQLTAYNSTTIIKKTLSYYNWLR